MIPEKKIPLDDVYDENVFKPGYTLFSLRDKVAIDYMKMMEME
jgi:hypothetical protein